MNAICLFGSIPDRRFCRIRTTADVVYVPCLSAGKSLAGHRNFAASGAIQRRGSGCVVKLHKMFDKLDILFICKLPLRIEQTSHMNLPCLMLLADCISRKKIMLLLSDKEGFIGKVEL